MVPDQKRPLPWTTRWFIGCALAAAALLGSILSASESDYDNPAYGGPWAVIHRDNRNSNWAPVAIANQYEIAYRTRLIQKNWVKPTIGPEGNVYFSYYGPSPGVLNRGKGPFVGQFIAYNENTGGEVFRLGPPIVNSTVTSSNALISVSGDFYLADNAIMAKYTPTGRIVWRASIRGAPSSAQFTSDGKVLFFSWNGWAYILDPEDGAVLLEKNMTPGREYPTDVPGICLASGKGSKCAYANTPAIDPWSGVIYETFNPADGGPTEVHAYIYSSVPYDVTLLWQNAALEGGSASSIVLSPDYRRLYVNDGANHTLALDAMTGVVIWKTQIGYSPGGNPSLSPGGYLFLNGNLHDSEARFTIIKDQGKQGEIVYQDTEYIPSSSVAAGLGDRFVVVGRSRETDGLELLVIHPTVGILSRTAWGESSSDRPTGVSLGHNGWVFVNVRGQTGLKAFKPVQ